MNDIIFPLIHDENEIEDFEENDMNLLQARVQLPDGTMQSSSKFRIEIRMSKDAMIGLGKELVRAGLNEKINTNFFKHLRPIEPELISQCLGVYLHPDSCELIFTTFDFDTVEKTLQKHLSEGSLD
jgi:hypothetical protein